jgi:Fic family protein
VTAGTIEANQLAGYRRGPVFIRNSMHTSLPSEAILDALEALWEMIEAEPEACVRAVLGHHLFVFIHPYYNGDGRIGRIPMNTLLASGGYPSTVIRMNRRDEYMNALEAASVKGQIMLLAQFIAQEMRGWAPERAGKA